ncbi:hypothetical protein ACFQ4O_10330 [Methylopila musalis]|uniref:Holin n=1 Tax=Methylopila musalis TaxID=1134781 RepID=A0ABW3Z810_9HYPH
MLDAFARSSLALASFVTSLFVASDAPNFGVVNAFVAITLLAVGVAVLAFWSPVLDWARRVHRDWPTQPPAK